MNNKSPTRKPIRLQNFDYSSDGTYFITICTHKRKNILSNIIVGEGFCALPTLELTRIGEIVNESIKYISENYVGFHIDKYVIMPNHIHLLVSKQTGGHKDPPLQIYDIIGNFKSFTTYKYGATLWQRSFHDHIIRGENDYLEIWNYIDTNPQKWTLDKYHEKI